MIQSKNSYPIDADTWVQLEATIERFENDWLAGKHPSIGDFLGGITRNRLTLLAELVHADLELRSKANLPVSVEFYLAKFPELAETPALLLELLVVEQELAGQSTIDASRGLENRFAAMLHRDGEFSPKPDKSQFKSEDPIAEPSGFGDIQLLEEIASGGMGVVYKARQISMDRIVALKMIRSGCFAGKQELRRFHLEVQALARVRHPNIVAIHEVGEVDGQPYFSMDFVDGSPLSDVVREGPLSPAKATCCVETLAQATDHLHKHGILHRDLKPSNILIDTTGRPIITDFGLARLTESDSDLTRTGQLVGTPSYMPPEQIDQSGAAVSEASDVYSLGAILYELLVGRPPFRAATSWSTIVQVRSRQPTSPSSLNADIDTDLETITLKCLEKNPEKRYLSAADLAEDLRRYRMHEPILARPVNSFQQFHRWCQRNTTVAWLSAAVLLLLVAGTVVSTYFAIDANRRENAAVRLAEEARNLAQQERSATAKASLEADRARRNAELARRQSYQLQLARAVERLRENPYQASLLLESEQCPPERRDQKWHFLHALLHRDMASIQAHRGRVISIDYIGDTDSLVSISYDQRIRIWNTKTGNLQKELPKQPHELVAVATSPDGKKLATAYAPQAGVLHASSIQLWDLESDRQIGEIRHLVGLPGKVSALAFSPDGTMLASGTDDFYGMRLPASVSLWDVETGELRFTSLTHLHRVSGLAFSPDGQQFASSSWDGTVRLWDTNVGEVVRTFDKHGPMMHIYAMAFAPDGRTIASGGKDNLIKLWDPQTGEERGTLRGHVNPILSLDFSSDSQTLVSASGDTTIKFWDVGTARMRATVGRSNSSISHVRFSPSDGTFASGSRDGVIKIWKTDPGDALTVRRGHTDTVNRVAYLDAGIVSSSNDGSIRIWDLRSSEVRVLRDHKTLPIKTLAISPDQQTIASVQHGGRDAVLRSAHRPAIRVMLRQHLRPITHIAFSPDCSTIATATDKCTIRLWDHDECRVLRQIDTGAGPIAHLLWGLHAGTLVSIKANVVRLWDTESGERSGGFSLPTRVAAACLASDSRVVVALDQGVIQIHDVNSGRPIGTLGKHGERVTSFSLSPDGNTLASGSTDWTIKLWDLNTLQEIGTLIGHTDEVTDLDFNSDGAQLVSSSRDRTIRTWDTQHFRNHVLHARAVPLTL